MTERHERWREIPGFEDYLVSDHGRVYRPERFIWTCPRGTWYRRRLSGKFIKILAAKGGYKRVTLFADGKQYWKSVHRLVALAFIPNPEAYPCINHIDARPWNNHVSNLEWCTHQQNISHAAEMGLMVSNSGPGEKSPAHKLSEADVRVIKERLISGESCKSVSRDYEQVTESAIREIKFERSWSHVKVGDDAA